MPDAGQPMGAFPFCSDRCRLIDLGNWLDGKYQIPVAEEEDDGASAEPPVLPTDDGVDPDSSGGANGGARRHPRPTRPN